MSQKSSKYKGGGSSCAAPGCTSTFYGGADGISFFRFPSIKDPERGAQWCLNSGAEHLYGISPYKLHEKKICSKHFEPSQFMNPNGKNKLIWNAVPTLFDDPNTPKTITPKHTDPGKRKMPVQYPSPAKKCKPVDETTPCLLPQPGTSKSQPPPHPKNDEAGKYTSESRAQASKTPAKKPVTPAKERHLKEGINKLCRERQKTGDSKDVGTGKDEAFDL